MKVFVTRQITHKLVNSIKEVEFLVSDYKGLTLIRKK